MFLRTFILVSRKNIFYFSIAGTVWQKPNCIAFPNCNPSFLLMVVAYSMGFFCNSLFCFEKNWDLTYTQFAQGLVIIPGMEIFWKNPTGPTPDFFPFFNLITFFILHVYVNCNY